MTYGTANLLNEPGVLPRFYTLRTLQSWSEVPVIVTGEDVTGKDVTGIELIVPPPRR